MPRRPSVHAEPDGSPLALGLYPSRSDLTRSCSPRGPERVWPAAALVPTSRVVGDESRVERLHRLRRAFAVLGDDLRRARAADEPP